MSSAAPRDARSLLAAARDDGPDAAEREAMFQRVALATGIATATAAAATSGATATAGAGAGAGASTAPAAATAAAAKAGGVGLKMLIAGGVIGAASTALGVVLAVTMVTPESGRAPAARDDGATYGAASTSDVATGRGLHVRVPSGARLADPAPRARDTSVPERDTPPAPQNPSDSEGMAASASAAPSANPGGDLAEEARLVTEARRALVGGDAARALAMVKATKKLGARAMEPEELGLEARALHALGRADEAAVLELELRRKFPDHALAR